MWSRLPGSWGHQSEHREQGQSGHCTVPCSIPVLDFVLRTLREAQTVTLLSCKKKVWLNVLRTRVWSFFQDNHANLGRIGGCIFRDGWRLNRSKPSHFRIKSQLLTQNPVWPTDPRCASNRRSGHWAWRLPPHPGLGLLEWGNLGFFFAPKLRMKSGLFPIPLVFWHHVGRRYSADLCWVPIFGGSTPSFAG